MQLSQIFRYPIKSARGHSLEVSPIDRFGLSGDRRWMLVDATGAFVTQRQLRQLALLEVEPLPNGLRLCFDGDALDVAVADANQPAAVTVWSDCVRARIATGRSAAWLSGHLGQDLRLAYLPDESTRAVDPDFAAGHQVSFADGFPLLLISQASLDLLNEKLSNAVPMDRFRPNLVVTGAPAHAEDAWHRIAIGEVELELVKPCSRCVIPSIDQASAERDPEINRVLASYRRRDGQIYFGMNAVVRSGTLFKRGDPVEILS